MISPHSIVPSSGTTFPICTATQSPLCTRLTGTSTSPSGVLSQTRSMLSDMHRARSSTDFLCVHSSKSSPSPSRNITEPAVPKSPRSMEIPIESASSSSTCSFRRHRQRRPLSRYGTLRATVKAMRSGAGKNTDRTSRNTAMLTSLSS